MKVVFLCGSLEPGRDGVGDYVRQLALELRHQGQQTAAIALNDQYITEEIVLAPSLAGEELPVLRLPASWAAHRRFQRAHQWVEEFQPTWISLQFVPYAFHPKGLPLALSRNLLPLTRGRQVHLMMHECWVGAEPGTGLKRQLMSYLQRKLVSHLIARLRPAVIHTHLPIYRTRLQRLGWRILPLPLFSNIPVLSQPSPETDPTIFRVGVFSQADANSSFIDFLTALTKQLNQRHPYCQMQVLLIGGEPTKMRALGATLEAIASLRGQVHYTDFLEPAQLSAALQSCQLGLTPVPRNGLGKSGSVAAFLAHSIPVAAPYVHLEAIPADIGFFSNTLRSAILLHPNITLYMTAKAAAEEAQSTIQISTIAQTFLADLLSK